MEGVGAQAASPVFIHGPLSDRYYEPPLMARKRDCPYSQVQSMNHLVQDQPHPSDPRTDWNLNSWDWDSIRFVAKPIDSEILQLGSSHPGHKMEREAAIGVPERLKKSGAGDEDDERLRLNLGGGLKSLREPTVRPNKRVRSGSPGSNYPMCQVDDCSGDLSSAKDYHRRHKVCEAHSKASKALVGKQLQRFCQQCSRFHPLPEFDEGKRSCRRRLAGHNRRRRKTQAEDASSRILSSGTKDNIDANIDISYLLTTLTQSQGKAEDKSVNSAPLPDREQILQILSKINALALPTNLSAKLASFRNAAAPGKAPPSHTKSNGAIPSPSTMDLLTALSATLLSQKNGQVIEFGKSKVNNSSVQSAEPEGHVIEINSVSRERSSLSFHSPMEDSDCRAMDPRPILPLQLFSSSLENCSPPSLPSSRKYFSSGSSNQTEEQSPSSSPVVQRLFPVQASAEKSSRPEITTTREVDGNVGMNRERANVAPLDLFRDYSKGPGQGSCQSSLYQTGYTSSSGSDHSPSSISLETQPERTGRIMFKLFDKDPSHLPGNLRSQIYHWLSSSPSEMESYIRPGCLVLSIYLSMTSAAWGQLQENLVQHLHTLLEGSEYNSWNTGRFLVHTGKEFASHNDGKIHLIKPWRANSPELISVSPVALPVGESIQLVLHGRNLVAPGTKVHFTCLGGYMSKEVAELSYEKSVFDEVRIAGFESHDEPSMTASSGRCFIEVENGFKGNSFPLIVADATICSELGTLESLMRVEKSSLREEALHFLNELGWLFQRRKDSSALCDPSCSLNRFKFLATFSVERDWCHLVRKLLDILAESTFDGSVPTKESLEALSEVHLLNRAVRRGCKEMVNLLINYCVSHGSDGSRTYVFRPNIAGPGGITPLHIAASTSDSIDIIDALTNDPQQIGLNSWSTLLDANGQSPHSYAAMRNNNSYNELVESKLSDRKNGQVSLTIGEIEIEQETAQGSQYLRQRVSCARCSAVATKPYSTRITKSQVLHRPYIHSMLVIAAVCVCVCLFLRGAPKVGLIAPFKWENLDYGVM